MVSIKDKIERMINITNGEVVRRCHAKQVGIYIADEKSNSYLKKKKRTGL